MARGAALRCALLPLVAAAALSDDFSLMMQKDKGAIDDAVDVAAEGDIVSEDDGPGHDHVDIPGQVDHSHSNTVNPMNFNPMEMFQKFMTQMQSFMPHNGQMNFGMPGMMDWWTQMGHTFSQGNAMQGMNPMGMMGGSGKNAMDSMGKMGLNMAMGGSGAAMGPMAHMSEGRRLLAQKELAASLDSTSGVMNAAWRMNERTWQIMSMWPMALAALPMVQSSGNRFVDQLSQWGQKAQGQIKEAVAKGDQTRMQTAEQVQNGINSMSENVLKQFDDFTGKASSSGASMGPMVMMSTASLPNLPGMKPLTDLMDNMQNMFKVGMMGVNTGGPNSIGQPQGDFGAGMQSLNDWMLKIQLQVLKSSTEQALRNMNMMVERMTATMQGSDKMMGNPQLNMMRDHFLTRMKQCSTVTSVLLTQLHDVIASGSLAVNQQVKRSFPDGEFQPSIAHMRERLGGLVQVMNELNLKMFEIQKFYRKAMMDELDAATAFATQLAQSTANGQMEKQVNNFVAGLEAVRSLMHRMEQHQLAMQERMVSFGNQAATKTASIIAGDAEKIQEATKMLDEMKEAVADLQAQEEALHKLQEMHRQAMTSEGSHVMTELGQSVNDIAAFDNKMGDIFNMQQPMNMLNKMMMDGFAQTTKMMQQGLSQADKAGRQVEDVEHHTVDQVVNSNNLLEGQKNFINFMAGQFATALNNWEDTYAKGNPLAQQFVSNVRQALSVMEQVVEQMAAATHKMTEQAGIAWKMPGMDGMMKLPSMGNMKLPGANDMMKNYQNAMTAGMNNAQSMMQQGMNNYQNMMQQGMDNWKKMANGAGAAGGSGQMMKQGMEMQQNMMQQGMDNWKKMTNSAGAAGGSGQMMKQGMEMQQNMMQQGMDNWKKMVNSAGHSSGGH